MRKHLSRPSRRARGIVALAALGICAALPASASAAPGTGSVELTLKPGGTSSLLGQDVQVRYSAKTGKTGSAKRAQTGEVKRVSLPVAEIVLGPAPYATTRGGLTLGLEGRKLTVQPLTVEAAAGGAAVLGKVGKQELVLFRAKGDLKFDSTSLKLDNGKLSLTGHGARALRKKLGLEQLAAGPLGSITLDAALTEAPKPPAADPLPLKHDIVPPPHKDPVDPYPFQTECPVGNVGGPSFGDTPGKVGGISPMPSFDPGIAQGVSGSSLEWGFKDSFRAYVGNIPPAGSMQGLEGAGTNPAGPTMALPGSFFDFPVADGTYEAGNEPDHSDDKLVSNGSGTALFCKTGHGFSVALRNPTVVIDGESSRIVADVGTNQKGTWYSFQRTDVAELDLSGIEPQLSDGGNTLVWEDIPATLSADGVLASGIYEEGETLDPITVRTSLQRPLLAECAINSGIGTPAAVDFTLAALPTLTDPMTGSGGTINWGFRRSLRSSVQSTGSFQLLGGATAGYPGNMGGGATPAPSGGIGKFFRFPISEYAYDAGDSGSALDDRLIATSEATVGFCNPAAGNYGVVISKPTLVIDGGNSRLVANAYSYSGGFPTPSPKGWLGGRVELVDLDTSAVAAVSGSGTVSWGEVTADETPLNSGIPVDGGLKTEALSLASLTIAGTASGGFDPVAAQIELPAP